MQELRLPWTLITDHHHYVAGDTFACGVELLWGEADWPVHRYADNLAPGRTQREFFFSDPSAWGPVTLERGGHLAPPAAPAAPGEPADAADGPVAIPFDLPAPARVTLAIDDAHGRRVRNLVAARACPAGANQAAWDGLDDAGRALPPGEYRYTALRHAGIHTRYAMSFANPGDPTWDTADGRGAFYADHTDPQAVAAGGDGVALACPMGEAGQHLIGCDLDGHRRWGLGNRGSGDLRHIALATDGTVLWVANDGATATVYRVELATGRYAPWTATAQDAQGHDYRVLDLPVSQAPRGPLGNLSALAAHGGRLAIALTGEHAVKVLDGASGAVQAVVALDAPRALAFAGDDLLVLDGAQLLRIAAARLAGPAGPAPRALAGDLADATALAVDARERIHVAVRGARQQVLVLGPDGGLQGEIGLRGGRPAQGAFIAGGMRQPAGLAIDARGDLWVAEEAANPKRVSVWTPAGALRRDFIGTTRYAAAGALNPFDPTMGFATGAVYRLDPAAGTSRPVWSLGPSGAPDELFPPLLDLSDTARCRVVRRDDALWVFSPGVAREGDSVQATLQGADGRWRAAARIGVVLTGGDAPAAYRSPLFAGHAGEVFAWCDQDGDGRVQAGELQFGLRDAAGAAIALRTYYWGTLPDADGTVTLMAADGRRLVQLPVVGATACAAPRYDLARARLLPLVLDGPAGGEGMIMGGAGARTYLNQEPLTAVEADGRVLSTYPNRFPGVHGSHHATAARPGLLIGPSSFLGAVDVGGGEIIDLNGNLGENYLLTGDLLYVQALFKDVRGGFARPERAVRGMPMDATTANGESFGGNFIRSADGRVLLTIGTTDARVIEVTGLDGIVRFAGAFTYTPAQWEAARRLVQGRAAARQAPRRLAIARAAGATAVAAAAASWPELFAPTPADAASAIPVAAIGGDGPRPARAQLRWDAQRLHLAWRVAAPADHLRNAGQDETLLFKTGDAVDLMLATPAGPVRLLISALAGKPLAVLYRLQVPGTAPERRVRFASPARSVFFDQVARLEDVAIAVAPCAGGFLVEAAVPWADLGLAPAAGATIPGDLGVLAADDGGTQTVARRYWSNQATGLVNDVPGEAELTPALWGTFVLDP